MATTINAYYEAHKSTMTLQQVREFFGIDKNDSSMDFYAVSEDSIAGFYKKHPEVLGKGVTVEKTTGRTQNLETDQFPENNKTYRLNQHIKNFKQADGILGKAKVAVVDVFLGDWDNIGDFIDGAFLK